MIQEIVDSRENDPEASEGCDWPQLCSLVAASERTKPRVIRCVAFASAPYKATRDGLASLVKSGRARRDLCDLSGDTVLQTDDAAVVHVVAQLRERPGDDVVVRRRATAARRLRRRRLQ